MKRLLPLILIVLFFIPSLACSVVIPNSPNAVKGSGNIVTQTVDVKNFSSVSLENSADVYLEQGSTESVTVEADDNILPLLETKVRGKELLLSTKPNTSIDSSRKIIYRITAKDLSGISLNGSGNFNVSPIKADSMDISLDGSGNIKIDELATGKLSIQLNGSGNIGINKVSASSTDASVDGSGDIRLAGQSPTQKISFNGSGNYAAGDLKSESVEISIPGSADVTVWATEELKAEIDGSGTVRYYGKPSVDQSGDGSGKIVSLGEK
jgi:hypothetical protein